jgi:ThiF family protein
MTEALHEQLVGHLARADAQEDLCFALYAPSHGTSRGTAVLQQAVLPVDGDRDVHGNVAFTSAFYERALALAMQQEAGLAFLHSHPARGWQGLSRDDARAEAGLSGGVLAATGLPLVGLTLGTRDSTWSARVWVSNHGRTERIDVQSVRVVGDALRVIFTPDRSHAEAPPDLRRSIDAWGPAVQDVLRRLRVGVVGAGSVGSVVAEGLARMGVGRISLIDFDRLQPHNRDRTLHATAEAAREGLPKVEALVRELPRAATALDFDVAAFQLSVVEADGYRRALDCDVLFSCVDRPWARSVLNFIAYAHLIPVIDGGIAVARRPDGTMRGAEWRAHVATVGHRCLSCLGQFDPGLVALEREGLLDQPHYIEQLDAGHVLRADENVFAFSLATASLELLHLILLIAQPSGFANVGAQLYHYPASTIEIDTRTCESWCPYPGLVAGGDPAGHPGTGRHLLAERARERGLYEPS